MRGWGSSHLVQRQQRLHQELLVLLLEGQREAWVRVRVRLRVRVRVRARARVMVRVRLTCAFFLPASAIFFSRKARSPTCRGWKRRL